MHACLALLGNLSPYSCCLCLHWSVLLKTSQVPRKLQNHSLSTVGCHRPKVKATGQEELVIDHLWGYRPTIHGRPTISSCKILFCCSRRQTEHGKAFSKQCLHHHPPYHVWDSKEYGSRPSGHQSRISTHDGQRSQVYKLMCNECTKHMNASHSIMLDQERRRPRIEACFITSSTKRPLILVFDLTSQTKHNAMQVYQIQCKACN